MSYGAFLLVMSQLVDKRKARVVIQSEVVFFEIAQKKNHYILYTKVYSGEGYLPKNVRSCFASSGMWRWQSKGAYLKLDVSTSSVYVFQEVEMQKGKYIPFRDHLNAFSSVASEWREIFQDFARKDYAFLPIF
jgi:hypothetical protein